MSCNITIYVVNECCRGGKRRLTVETQVTLQWTKGILWQCWLSLNSSFDGPYTFNRAHFTFNIKGTPWISTSLDNIWHQSSKVNIQYQSSIFNIKCFQNDSISCKTWYSKKGPLFPLTVLQYQICMNSINSILYLGHKLQKCKLQYRKAPIQISKHCTSILKSFNIQTLYWSFIKPFNSDMPSGASTWWSLGQVN